MTGTHLQTQAYLCHLASSFPGEEFPLGLELFVHRTSDTGLSSDSAEWEGYPCPYTGGEECSTLPHPEPQVDRGAEYVVFGVEILLGLPGPGKMEGEGDSGYIFQICQETFVKMLSSHYSLLS